jgi:hypothetical protein
VAGVAEPIGTAPYRHGVAVLDAGRPVVALVDTAGTALCLSMGLAEELELVVHEWIDDEGTPVAVVDPPVLRVGDVVLDTEGLVAYAFEDTRPLGLAARRADVLLPAPVLRRHHVVLDAPAGQIVVGPPGSLERRGVVVPTQFDDHGLIAVTIEVDGEPHDVVLDTALTCCLAVDGVLRGWQERHRDWPASASAVGPGNVTGSPMEARIPMVRVPELQVGPFAVPQVAFAWRGAGDVAGDGALGGNVLDLFRVDLDYSARSVRLEQGRPFAENDAELVGMVLAFAEDGWLVAATVSGLEDVHPGDILVYVDDVEVADLALPGVLDLLRGSPGDRRHLVLHRDDEVVEVDAPVLRLL